MEISKVIPKYKQWEKWSLPSKYTAIGLLIGVVSLIGTLSTIFNAETSSLDLTTLKGEYTVVDLGEHEINYGAMFISPPKMEFLGGRHGGIEKMERFKIIKQNNY